MPSKRVKTKEDIIRLLIENKQQIERFGIQRIKLFGSFLHNEQHPMSDVDLLVYYKESPKTWDRICEIDLFFEKLFRRKVDVINRKTVNKYMRPFILASIRDPSYRVSQTAKDVCSFRNLYTEVIQIKACFHKHLFDEFETDTQKGNHVTMNCFRIGLRAKKISTAFKKQYPEIPWRELKKIKSTMYDLNRADYERNYEIAQRLNVVPKARFRNIIRQYKNIK
ncbi:MAG: nucleotidyltransferase domain-containing protein [Bacteroidota bacterium]